MQHQGQALLEIVEAVLINLALGVDIRVPSRTICTIEGLSHPLSRQAWWTVSHCGASIQATGVTIRGAFFMIPAPPGYWICVVEAGGEGFEPPLTVPETAVLPLDDPPEIGAISPDDGDSTMESAVCKVRVAGAG